VTCWLLPILLQGVPGFPQLCGPKNQGYGCMSSKSLGCGRRAEMAAWSPRTFHVGSMSFSCGIHVLLMWDPYPSYVGSMSLMPHHTTALGCTETVVSGLTVWNARSCTSHVANVHHHALAAHVYPGHRWRCWSCTPPWRIVMHKCVSGGT